MFLNLIIKSYRMTAGIIPNKKIALIAITIISILSIVAVGGMIIAVFSTNQDSYRTITMGFLCCISFSCSLQLITKLYEDHLNSVIQKLRQNTFTFTKQSINDEAEREMEQKFWRLIILLMICCTTCLVCPYLYFITKPEISYDDPDLQVIPFFLAYWQTNTLPEYFAMVMLQLSITGITIIAYWSFTIFTMYVVVHLQKHVETLNQELNKVLNFHLKRYFIKHVVKNNDRIKNIIFIKKQHVFDSWQDDFEDSLSKDLINIIKYQQFIHNYIVDFVKYLNRPYTSVFSWYISSTIVFAYSFLQVIGDAVFFIKTLSLVIHGTVALYLYCQAAQIVNHLNESIRDAFYNTEWYYVPPKIRKSFIVILMQCQRKYEIKTFAMYMVNLNLFIRSLRIVYSVLNVVLVTQKK